MERTRLLERIRSMARKPSENRSLGETDMEALQNSILGHLVRLLNTRQGSSIIAQDYGMPDLTYLCSTDNVGNIAKIESILTSVIQHYEPRLSDVRVRFCRDKNEPFTLCFALTATLTGRQNDTMYFQTVLTPNGRISVRRYREDESEENGNSVPGKTDPGRS